MLAKARIEGVWRALGAFGAGLTQAFDSPVAGDPEDQLKSHVRPFIEQCGKALGFPVVAKTESRYADVGGRPDLGIDVRRALCGHIELKAPGYGANPNRFTGHNRRQWNNFKNLPNLIYTDGTEWTLFHTGKRVARVQLSGDPTSARFAAATAADAEWLAALLHTFFSWQPIAPATAKQLAESLAPLARLLRGELTAALEDENSAVSQLHRDWQSALFADADSPQFADAYAQTLTYALLLARLDGLEAVGTGEAAQEQLREGGHALLAEVLRNMADPQAREEFDTPLVLLERAIGAVDVSRLRRGDADPWLYFYEHFLSAYDPALRNNRGVYYTPVEVVRAQVRLIGDLLERRFGKTLTYADEGVVTLDPAAGTGTYPLAVIEHALDAVDEQLGPGAIPSYASTLARNVHSFELLVGAYAVAHLRISERIQARAGVLPEDGAHVYLSDTLESPYVASPGHLPLALRSLTNEHERARQIKAGTRVLVCLGNPPYDRQEINLDDVETQRKGGWVRNGDPGTQADAGDASRPLLNDFLDPAREAGAGVHLKNLYNDYVYFWRWALWKVFDSTGGPGIVSFITAASYLRGPGFVGMREVMRRTFDELWIIDLEGDSLGARKTENVFAITTPVAIAVGVRYERPKRDTPATTRYVRLTGTAEEKLARLEGVQGFEDLDWQSCFEGWQEPLLPDRSGDYYAWPQVTDLFPWSISGAQTKRTWVIGSNPEVLKRRWAALMASFDRASPFRETRDRRVNRTYPDFRSERRLPPLESLDADASCLPIERYAYRSFDRQWLLADSRVADFIRPVLWQVHSHRQVHLSSLLTNVLGSGPAATVAANIPDLDHFRGSYGAKHVIPLWRDSDASEPNVTAGLLAKLGGELGCEVRPEDLFAYCYAVLASPHYVNRFSEELTIPGPRVPLTKDRALFRQGTTLGAELIRLHTYGERFAERGKREVFRGAARCTRPVGEERDAYPQGFDYDEWQRTLRVGVGEFGPVRPEVWQFSVSGFQVVKSWLGYRMRDGTGRRSSPLDEIRPTRWTAQFTRELLELLWVLEATVERWPKLAELLDAVVAGECFGADELPTPEAAERRAPRARRRPGRSSVYTQSGLD